MKKYKKALSLVLAVLMTLTALPPVTLAEAAGTAYTVLLETELRGDLGTGTSKNSAVLKEDLYFNHDIVGDDVYDTTVGDDVYNNNTVGNDVYGPTVGDDVYDNDIEDFFGVTDISVGPVEVYRIVQYTGTEIEKLSETYKDVDNFSDGFSESGYIKVRTSYSGWTFIVDAQGNQLAYSKIPSVDGYVTSSSYKDRMLDYTITNIQNGSSHHFTSDYSVDVYNNGRINAYRWIDTDGDGYIDRCQYVYLDSTGARAFSETFQNAYPFSHGYAVIITERDSVCQIIDIEGNTVFENTDNEYDEITLVSRDGLVLARKTETGDYGYLDVYGNEIIPFQYKKARNFMNGYAVVTNHNGKEGLINTAGQIVIPFGTYDRLTDVSETGILWAWSPNHDTKTVLKVNVAGTQPPGADTGGNEYIYDTHDPGANMELPVDLLDDVTDMETAVEAVESLIDGMTDEQKSSPTGIDLATLYAEVAAARAASRNVTGSEILIDPSAVAELEGIARQTNAAVEDALTRGGVTTARYLANTVTLVTENTGELRLTIDPQILTTGVDKIRIETPAYTITLKTADLAADLTEMLTITTQNVGGSGNEAVVQIDMPDGKITNPITVSMPSGSGDTTYQTVVTAEGTPAASKYNPATTTMDGKVTTSGSYTVTTNEKDFTDIANKSAEMQNAIRYLASKGIINGTTATEFSPDGSISRAEIAALLVRALGKLDSAAEANFTDVTPSNWYYAAAGSSQRHGLIKGFEDATFRGTQAILKEQIVVVSARVLTSEMNYKAPDNPTSYLSRYSDDVAAWAQPEVALATRENLVLYRTDGTFAGAKDMTRGDAAIIIYRLFQRIW